ncbi:acyltransferase [bacterium]|nr:acyltransferase [bacterium]
MLNFIGKIVRGLKSPSSAMGYVFSLLRGHYYRFKYSLLFKKACFGKKFRVQGPLKISGPGKVLFGDNVLVCGLGHPVTPFTHHKDAVIKIGSNSFVNGTRFGCQISITIGEYAILGDARILDTDFHSIYPDRWSPEAIVESAPISIGKNVWVGANAAVLKGVTIGDNSVVGFGAVLSKSIPGNCVVAGNPATIIKQI